jgi:glycosyltransferase involved in cell wall biosynthesis
MLATFPPKKRILFLLKDLSFGGAERVCLNLVRALPAEQFESTLFVCGDSLDMQAEVPEHATVFMGLSSQFRFRQTFFPLLKKLRKIVNDYDVIVATSPDTTALMSLSGARKAVQRISWVHFDTQGFLPNANRLIRAIAKAVYPRTANRVFISQSSKASFVKEFGARPADIVIPNIFDPVVYGRKSSTEQAVRELRTSGLPVYGFVGRLVSGKGLDGLLDIHQSLVARGHDHHIAVIGDGPLSGSLSEALSSRGLTQFHLLGADASPVGAMRHFNALFVTSDFEAWPTVILEAFHTRVPVISFDCPSGPREMLTGPLSKGLVPFSDVEAFCTAVLRLPLNRSELVVSGLERVQPFYPAGAVKPWLTLLKHKA